MLQIQHCRHCRLPVITFCVFFALLAVAATHAAARPLDGRLIVLDPGHGGKDAGVDPAGSGLIEKEVTLDLAFRLQKLLEADGATVFLTRVQDQHVTQQARVQFANALLFRPDNRADQGRMVSLHINSNRNNPNLARVEVLVDPQAEPPFDLAELLATKLRDATGGSVGYRDAGYPDGVHPADVAVVRWTYPRGRNVLSESAFLSNATQAAQLKQAAFREGIVRAHLDALRAEFAR